MGGLIETLLGGLLGGVLALLGVWLSGRQEHKRAREAREADREADKEKMLYEKQLEVLEEAVKWLTFMHIEWKGLVGVVYGESGLTHIEQKMGEEMRTSLIEKTNAIAKKMFDFIEDKESREMMAKISTYLPLETKEAFGEYSVRAIASVKGVGERLLRGEDGDVEGTKEQLDVAYTATVLKMREHLGIRESVGDVA